MTDDDEKSAVAAALEWAADAIYQQDGGAPGTFTGWKSDEAMAHWFTIRRLAKQS